jgi:hypothetical protein
MDLIWLKVTNELIQTWAKEILPDMFIKHFHKTLFLAA